MGIPQTMTMTISNMWKVAESLNLSSPNTNARVVGISEAAHMNPHTGNIQAGTHCKTDALQTLWAWHAFKYTLLCDTEEYLEYGGNKAAKSKIAPPKEPHVDDCYDEVWDVFNTNQD